MRIAEAPRNPRLGYLEARPGDVAGRHDLLLVDIRDQADLTGRQGHIHGVTHRRLERVLEHGLPGVDTAAPVVLVCGDGRRSARAAQGLMREHGFTEVYVLVGGMRRWNAEERPVARVRSWVAWDAVDGSRT